MGAGSGVICGWRWFHPTAGDPGVSVGRRRVAGEQYGGSRVEWAGDDLESQGTDTALLSGHVQCALGRAQVVGAEFDRVSQRRHS